MHRPIRSRCTAWLAAVLASAAVFSTTFSRPVQAEETKKITYEDHILPIFRQKCFACHNTSKKSGGIDLTSFTSMMQGGGSGAAIEPGDPAESYLFRLVNHDSEPYMPPNSEKIDAAMIATLSQWIEGGALENSGSKSLVKKKPKMDLSLAGAPIGKPDGPPAMPARLGLEPVIHTAVPTTVTALATSPWAPLAAVGGHRQVLLYHTENLSLLGVLPFPEGVPQILKFSRNGNLLLAGGGIDGASGKVIVWDVRSGDRVIEVGDELDTVLTADISADQTLIALGGPQKIVRVYSTATGELVREITKHTDWICSVAFSPDGVLLATADRAGGLHVWEALTGRQYLTLDGHKQPVWDLSWRLDSNVLASCSEDATVKMWEMENGGQIKSYGAHGGGTTSVEFTRDGRMVTSGRDQTVKLWDQNGAAVRTFPGMGDIATRVTYCDETKRVIGGNFLGKIVVWNEADGAEIGPLTMNPPKLEARIAEATTAVAATGDAAAKAAAALKAAQDEVTATQNNLNAATAALEAAKKTIAESTAKVTALNAAITKLTAELTAAQQQLTALAAAAAPLKESLAKIQEAAAKVPDDKALAAVAAQVKAETDRKATEVAATQKVVAEKTAAIDASKKELAETEKVLAAANAAQTTAQKQVTDLTAALKVSQEKAAAAKAAADQAAAAANQATASLNRWKQEVDFQTKLVAYREQSARLDELDLTARQAEAVVAEATAKLTGMNQTLEAQQKEFAAATAAAGTAKQTADGLQAEVTAAAATIAGLQGLIPALQETVAKAAAAATKAPNDAEVAALATGSKTLLDKRNGELAAVQKTEAEKKTALTAAQQVLATAQKTAADKQAAVAGTQKAIAEATEALKPLQQAAAVARKAADDAKATTEAARKAVDAMVAESAPAGDKG